MLGRSRLDAVAVGNRSNHFGTGDGDDRALSLAHGHPVRVLQRGRPATQRFSLVVEVRLPARIPLGLGPPCRRLDAHPETGGRVEVWEVGEIPVTSVDESYPARAPLVPRAEGDCDLGPPREADEERPLHAEGSEQIRRERRERGRAVRLCSDSRRAAVTRGVRGDHAESIPLHKERRQLVRVQAGAAETVPVQNGRCIFVSPLVDEERSARRFGHERSHRVPFRHLVSIRRRSV